ncbi:MAG: DUF2812 domain-containing protein [Firmicutes bacterium]|nr:DUF2812 domain-containing protein [Bacillota bacterium]
MSNKKEIKFFNIMQYEEEAAYLRNMHKSGWKFMRMTGLGMYHFESCEPEDVIYQLDYNQEGLKNKEEYVQMFADCGWEYLQDAFGYSYFRKPASQAAGEESIFCDEASRMEMMNRVFKGRLIPLIVIYCCCLLPQLLNATFIYDSPVIAALLGGLVGLYTVIFGMFAYQYYQFMRNKKR